MSGWLTIQKIRKLEQTAESLGMKFAATKYENKFGESASLIPKDADSLPIYCRDAELFSGSLEAADYFMRGIEWARDYDRMLIDKKMDTKRERKEQDERNSQLLKTLKDGVVPHKEYPKWA